MNILKLTEPWSTDHQARWVKEAVAYNGERVLIRQVFKLEDKIAGLTSICTACQASDDALAERLAALYKQSSDSRCNVCYGTSYKGGFRSTVYRSFILPADDDEEYVRGQGGNVGGTMLMNRARMKIETFDKPKLSAGDLIVRGRWTGNTMTEEEQRYIVTGPVARVTLRTGTIISAGEDLLVGQSCTMTNLPQDHIFYQVPLG